MATSSGRRVAAVKFFKIILLDPEADTLTIPPEFTKRHGQNLPNSVFLKVPFGTPMEVKLVRSDGKTVLQRGWKEFKNRYSIGFGHFLVFEQIGKSEFNVAIFDKSAVEINYPVHADYKRGKRKAENDPIQISDDDIGPVKLEDSTPEECWDGVEKERAVAKETSMAYKKAMDFVSVPNNPFFVRLLQPSHVSGRSKLSLSTSFVKQNLWCEGAISIIMVTNGKEWPGRCIVRNNYADVSVGWKKFVQDNGLKVGDACVFEVANKSKNHVLNVVIFRKSECVGMDTRSGRGLAAQNGKSEFNVAIFDKSTVEIKYPVHADYKRGKRKAEDDPIQISSDDIGHVKLEDSTPEECYSGSQCWDGVERERAVAKETSMAYKKAMDFVSVPKNPFSVRLLQPSHVSGRSILNISISFAKQNLCCEGANSIIMVTNGKKWPGRCIVRNNIAAVTVGWKKFVQDNGLKVGDACVFEVANKSKNHVWQWNVVIFRKSECVGMDTRSGRGLAAPKFCKIILDPRAETSGIPLEFTKRIGHTLPNHVFLKVSSTGSTAMEVELVQTNSGQTMLQKGWRKFKERHSLAFGHFLVFEYNEDSEFNVCIFDKSAVETNNHSHADYNNNKKVTNKKPRIRNRSKTQENTTRMLQQNHSERKPDCRVKLDHGTTFEECGDIGATRQFSKKVKVQRTVVKKETSVAYEKAVAFASAHINPKTTLFHIHLMKPSYVSYGFYMMVPLSFAKQNRLCFGTNSITLVTNGKKWPVRCIVKDRRANLSRGWKRYAQDNGLKIHDVCVFVVVDRTKPVWNVVIFRS